MVLIKGLQKTSLIDFTPYTSAVIFTGGCNFRCGFCHNPELVLHFNEIDTIPEKEVLDFHGKKYLKALEKFRNELSMSDKLDKFASAIVYDNLTLSKRHVVTGTKRHEDKVLEWMDEMEKAA